MSESKKQTNEDKVAWAMLLCVAVFLFGRPTKST